MTSDLVIWAIFFSFFILAFAFMFLDAFYINKKGWASFGKAFLCSFLAYSISLAVCFVICFIVFGVILAMSWDGSISKFQNGEIVLIVVLILTVLFVPFFTTMCKWLLLKLFKIQSGMTAFVFAAISSTIAIIVSLGLPGLVMYLVAGMKF